MSSLMEQLAAFTAAAPSKSSSGGAAVPPPPEQLEAIAALLGQRVAAVGVEGDNFIGIPPSLYQNEDGTAKPWRQSAKNPVTEYANSLRALYCGCRGGNGTYVWIGQTTRGKKDETTGLYPVYGVEVKAMIPASAGKIGSDYLHLQRDK